jgi:hypothetical protein
MSVVQDFECNFNSSNPMVHYKIYNKSVSLPLSDFSGRRSLSLLEPELDAYIAEQDQQAEGDGGEAEDHYF